MVCFIRELEGLRLHYEGVLADEGAEKVKLRGQAGVLRQKHEDCREQLEKAKEEAKLARDKAVRLSQVSDTFPPAQEFKIVFSFSSLPESRGADVANHTGCVRSCLFSGGPETVARTRSFHTRSASARPRHWRA